VGAARAVKVQLTDPQVMMQCSALTFTLSLGCPLPHPSVPGLRQALLGPLVKRISTPYSTGVNFR